MLIILDVASYLHCLALMYDVLQSIPINLPAILQAVQSDLHQAMSSSNDDVGMWDSFHEILTHAGRTAKSGRPVTCSDTKPVDPAKVCSSFANASSSHSSREGGPPAFNQIAGD